MSKRILLQILIVLASIATTGAILARAGSKPGAAARENGSVFTYQGQLQSGAAAADGQYDFRFSMYDSPEHGNQIGQTAAMDGVELSDGRFSVSLDFGPRIEARQYLEVAVRPSNSREPFTTLSPRQSLAQEPASPSRAGVRVPADATGVVTRTVSVNPGAFLYDQDSTDIQMSIYYGLRWAANTTERAGFYMARPGDWDGLSPVSARITFALGSNDAGAVNWRLRLNSYTPHSGEWLTNPASRDADDILVFASGPSSLRIYDQTFTLQPEDFNDEPYWSLFFIRGDATNGETFAANLYVMGVDIIYQTVP